MTRRKKTRNLVYRVCGGIMVGCILILGVYALLYYTIDFDLDKYCIVYWFETIALIAFGFSWLVKAEVFFKDI